MERRHLDAMLPERARHHLRTQALGARTDVNDAVHAWGGVVLHDVINNTLRLPYRERLSILLSELGTALAGRGEELNKVIHRANPALRETDDVLKILADQNRELARLARNSDEALAPLAREREAFADFVVKANETGQASAERSDDIRRGIALLPDFLAELEPLMADLEDFADQGIPLLADLGDSAPALGRLIKAQGTLADSSRESFPSLGDALERGRPALIRSRPLFQDLNKLGKQLGPTSIDLDDLLKSLDQTGGLERLNELQVSEGGRGFRTLLVTEPDHPFIGDQAGCLGGPNLVKGATGQIVDAESLEILKRWDGRDGVRVILHPRNLGKGRAVRTAMDEARGEILVIQDADLEYDPSEYPVLLRPIEAGRADVVYGSRFTGEP